MDKILIKAQNNFDFYETQTHHSKFIYEYHNPKRKLKVIDICCGLGSLINPWYDEGHDITIIEINNDFIPILKEKYPNAKIITDDYLTSKLIFDYDVILCNPPFNNKEGERIYPYFFCKILREMCYPSTLYFICPKMFYTNQMDIKLDVPIKSSYELIDFIKTEKLYPAKYYYDLYKFIELHSNKFRFNKMMIKRMIDKNIIYKDFIKEYEPNEYTIEPYFEFRFLRDVFDFSTTKCQCGLFAVNC